MEFGYIFTDFPFKTKTEGLKQLKCTSFILIDKVFGPMIFDTGSVYDSEYFLSSLKKVFNLNPEDILWIFITHIHPDHIGSTRFFKNAKLILSKNEYEFGNKIAKTVFEGKDLLSYLHKNCPGYINSFEQFEADNMQYHIEKHWTKEKIGFNLQYFFIEDNPGIPSFIKIMPSFGHTFNHYSFLIQVENIDILITGDALSMRMILRNDHEERYLEPHMDFNLYFKTLNYFKNFKGLFIPGHDRPFFSQTFKPIRKNHFLLKEIHNFSLSI